MYGSVFFLKKTEFSSTSCGENTSARVFRCSLSFLLLEIHDSMISSYEILVNPLIFFSFYVSFPFSIIGASLTEYFVTRRLSSQICNLAFSFSFNVFQFCMCLVSFHTVVRFLKHFRRDLKC